MVSETINHFFGVDVNKERLVRVYTLNPKSPLKTFPGLSRFRVTRLRNSRPIKEYIL